MEGEGHGDVAGVGEDLSGVEDGVGGERGGEGEERERDEREEKEESCGGHGGEERDSIGSGRDLVAGSVIVYIRRGGETKARGGFGGKERHVDVFYWLV